MTQPTAQTVMRNRAAVAEELRRLLPKMEGVRAAKPIPFGLAAIDRYLPQGGLACGALHEIVPEAGATPAAFGFLVGAACRPVRNAPAFSRSPGLRAARLRPAAWSWLARARSRSEPADPGGDGASQRHTVGHGGGAALARAGRRRRRHRPARSENQSKAASGRDRLRAAALSAAAGLPPTVWRSEALRRHAGASARLPPCATASA